MLLSLYSHQNIVSLLGYCDDSGEKILVYEYASKKSLDHYLDSMELSWVQRLKICIGAARGLAYLHTPGETKLRVLHRDIKSANILLDDDLNARIADFGLSKFAPANNQFSYLVTDAVGTICYGDPVYFETGLLTKESDVYSLGVVLFEVLCGRLCFGNTKKNQRPLIELVQECYGDKRINEIIFGKIKDEIRPYSLEKFLSIAYQCLNKDRKKRPPMTEIVKALESALESQMQSSKADGGTQIFGILIVTLITGTGFGSIDDLRVTVRTSTRDCISVHNTTLKYGKMTHESYEKFSLYLNEPINDTKLQIMVHNAEWSRQKKMYRCEGMDEIELGDLTPEGSKFFSASISDMGKRSITVEVTYKTFPYYTILEDVCPVQPPVVTAEGRGFLVVIIHEGIGFKGKSHTNTYASFSVIDSSIAGATTPIYDTCNPTWEETFTIEAAACEVKGFLHLEVVSIPWKLGLTRFYKEFEFIGEVQIDISDIINKKRINKLYPLHKRSGWVQMELQWISSD